VVTGKELKRIRLVMELEQTELAKKLGVHSVTVSRWETGASPVPKAIALLVKLMAKEQP
jgi:DNA-binding transcriptional regulator YiaG